VITYHFSVFSREVLLIGDGAAMRFWPMWPFYLYLNHSFSSNHADSTKIAGKLTLVTPETPNFQRGMDIADAVRKFCVTEDPIIYFMVNR
jgi:hypothetical protein